MLIAPRLQARKGTAQMNNTRTENTRGRFFQRAKLLMIRPSIAILCTIVWLTACTTMTAPEFSYPNARRSDVVENFHGTKVADPYRWMEELDSPETRAWVLAEAHLTDSYLEKIPARGAIKQRLTKLLNYEKYGTPFHHGNRYFYTLNKGLQPHAVLYTTIGLKGEPTVAFDPNTLSTNGSVGVVGYVASHNGAILGYGLAQGGGDWTDWHFREVKSGKDFADVIRWTKYYAPVFAPDGRGVYFSAFLLPREARSSWLGI